MTGFGFSPLLNPTLWYEEERDEKLQIYGGGEWANGERGGAVFK